MFVRAADGGEEGAGIVRGFLRGEAGILAGVGGRAGGDAGGGEEENNNGMEENNKKSK